MKNAAAAQVRAQIEGALATRIPSALTPMARLQRDLAPVGIAEVDAMLGGGFPVGAITEIVGTLGSGRASYAQAFVSQSTGKGNVCAWVDVADSFDPESAAANQVDLERLLWVRCGDEVPAAQLPARVHARPNCEDSPAIGGGCGSPHPRGETRGLSTAVVSFLDSDMEAMARVPARRRDKSIGTPGVANRKLDEAPKAQADRVEQVAYDRLPARRGPYVLSHRAAVGEANKPHQAGALVKTAPGQATAAAPQSSPKARQPNNWKRLDQAIRAADLLLQTGGFAVLVLDLGTLAPSVVNRVPLATWFRFRAAAERTRTSVVLLTQHPSAQTSAELVLRTAAHLPEAGTVLTGLRYSAEILRQRFEPESKVVSMRKGPQRVSSAQWQATSAWVGAR